MGHAGRPARRACCGSPPRRCSRFYVANFASYNKTYGSLGGVIVFLTWLWITNIIVLLGAEFNSEMERTPAIRGGHPPEKEPYLPLRDEPKED